MEPRIQYAKTKDGVSIAFYTLGEGMPIVEMVTVTSIQHDWKMSEAWPWFEREAEKRKLVRFDSRGTGLSDRDTGDYSLDAQMLDLEAVVKHLDLGRLALAGSWGFGPLAISYAAQHPERVSHLILMNSFARASDLMGTPQAQGLLALLDKDWELYTETLAHVVVGWSAGEPAQRYAALLRESLTPEYVRASIAALADVDVTDLLPRVRCPTLVLYRRQMQVFGSEVAQGLSSRIPDARLVLMEGSLVASTGEMEALQTTIDEFLGEGEEAEAKAELPEGMAVLLFADIANSTALTEQLGDAAFREKARELDTSLRSIIGESGGTPVEGKVLGDGVLAVFTSARQAIDCALRCNANSERHELQLHLGIHAGDVIREGNNVYGGAVNIAARIAGASAPGEVLVSDTVRSLARTSAGVTFDDRGEQSLKGIGEPQRLFAVRGGE